MKKLFPLLLLLVLSNCKEENKKESTPDLPIAKKEKPKKNNEVVIGVNDSLQSFFTNLFVNEMQDKPDMIYLGKEHKKTFTAIPTESPVKIVGGDPFTLFYYEVELQKGDSMLIDVEKLQISPSRQIDYPLFKITNGERSWAELNFDYLLYRKNISNKAIEFSSSESFSPAGWDPEKIYDNSLELLDSLKNRKEISSDFYTGARLNQQIKLATAKVREANNKNEKLDIQSLGLSLNDKTQLKNKAYIGYLRAVVLYEYFRQQKRVPNSVQFDFIAENKTLLEEDSKLAVLDSYLRSIFFVEKNKFEGYLNKFNSINTNTEIKDKWAAVLSGLNSNKKKLNRSNRNIGILTNLVSDSEFTFDEILAHHKDKVVLIDFWASWCSPCRREMPYLKDLKSKFGTDELQIIEISIDKDYAAWERASKMEKLANEEHSYIIANWEKSNLYKNYEVKTIPRYLLFDKAGKIINEDAPRPSDKKLEELIRASLEP
ncbi:redoxin family protein [Leptobacterium flavescens]|uniref:Redoxin family protein n=1 Tax=Leptobacterium flavescens TaxID=472055 RepID=A0A6P0UWB5_9FLAO|nr:TlpA disulfide reductase family protein [Leptobacterium flavescens]NER15063.1 redoxin family protein [Leptobacterium flavescens]